MEGIFCKADTIRSLTLGSVIGRCSIGSALSRVLEQPLPSDLLDLFREERFLLWFDPRSLHTSNGHPNIMAQPFVHIFFKDKYTQEDQLKSWILGTEICCFLASNDYDEMNVEVHALTVIRRCWDVVQGRYPEFLRSSQTVGWNREGALTATSPSVIITVADLVGSVHETKKTR